MLLTVHLVLTIKVYEDIRKFDVFHVPLYIISFSLLYKGVFYFNEICLIFMSTVIYLYV